MWYKLSMVLLPFLMACGNFERTGYHDPLGGGVIEYRSLVVGTWSRDDAEKNQYYVFKKNGRAELRDFTAPDGGVVDRNGAFPQTLVFSFSGTYTISGDVLRITFASVQTNDPGGETPSLRDKVIRIYIQGDELTMKELDGDRVFTRI